MEYKLEIGAYGPTTIPLQNWREDTEQMNIKLIYDYLQAGLIEEWRISATAYNLTNLEFFSPLHILLSNTFDRPNTIGALYTPNLCFFVLRLI